MVGRQGCIRRAARQRGGGPRTRFDDEAVEAWSPGQNPADIADVVHQPGQHEKMQASRPARRGGPAGGRAGWLRPTRVTSAVWLALW